MSQPCTFYLVREGTSGPLRWGFSRDTKSRWQATATNNSNEIIRILEAIGPDSAKLENLFAAELSTQTAHKGGSFFSLNVARKAQASIAWILLGIVQTIIAMQKLRIELIRVYILKNSKETTHLLYTVFDCGISLSHSIAQLPDPVRVLRKRKPNVNMRKRKCASKATSLIHHSATDMNADSGNLPDFLKYILALEEFKTDEKMTRNFLTTFIHAVSNPQAFNISLEDISLWTGVRHDNIKRLLDSYSLDRDYKVVRCESTGGRPKNRVCVSTDCFKRLCMRLRGVNSEKVRTYFILIEEKFREFLLNRCEKRGEFEEILNSKRRYETKTSDKEIVTTSM